LGVDPESAALQISKETPETPTRAPGGLGRENIFTPQTQKAKSQFRTNFCQAIPARHRRRNISIPQKTSAVAQPRNRPSLSNFHFQFSSFHPLPAQLHKRPAIYSYANDLFKIIVDMFYSCVI
jgi:hypothetical protein